MNLNGTQAIQTFLLRCEIERLHSICKRMAKENEKLKASRSPNASKVLSQLTLSSIENRLNLPEKIPKVKGDGGKLAQAYAKEIEALNNQLRLRDEELKQANELIKSINGDIFKQLRNSSVSGRSVTELLDTRNYQIQEFDSMMQRRSLPIVGLRRSSSILTQGSPAQKPTSQLGEPSSIWEERYRNLETQAMEFDGVIFELEMRIPLLGVEIERLRGVNGQKTERGGSDFKIQIEALQCENDRLNAVARDAINHAALYKERLRTIEERNEQSSLCELPRFEEMDVLMKEVEILRSSLKKSAGEKDSLQNLMAIQSEELRHKTEEIENLRSGLTEAMDAICLVETERESFRIQLTEIEGVNKDASETFIKHLFVLGVETERLALQNNGCREELDFKQTDINKLKHRILVLEDELKAEKENIKRRQHDEESHKSRESKEKIAESQRIVAEELPKWKNLYNEKMKENKILMATLEELRIDETKKVNNERQIEEIFALKKQVNELNQSSVERERMLILCRAEVDEAKRAIEELRGQNLSVSEKNKHCEEELRRDKERLRTLQHEIEVKEKGNEEALMNLERKLHKAGEEKEGALTTIKNYYTNSIALISTENERLSKIIVDAEDRQKISLGQLKEQLQTARSEQEYHSKLNSVLGKKQEEILAENEKLRKELKAKSNELKETKTQLQEEQLKAVTFNREKSSLQEENREISADIKLMAKGMENMQRINGELSKEVEGLRDLCKAANAQKQELEITVSNYSSKNAYTAEVSSTLAISTILISTELERQILFKQAEKMASDTELKKLQSEVTMANTELEGLRWANQRLTQEVERLKDEAKSTASDTGRLRLELESVREEKEKIREAAEREKAKVAEEMNWIEKEVRKGTEKRLTSELQKLKYELVVKEEEIMQARCENERQSLTLNTMKLEVNQLQKQSRDDISKRDSLYETETQQKLRILFSEKDILETELRVCTAEKGRLRGELNILYERYNALEKNYTNLEEKLEEDLMSSAQASGEDFRIEDSWKLLLLSAEVERLHNIKNDNIEEVDELETAVEELQNELQQKETALREERANALNLVLVSAEVERLHELKAEIIEENKTLFEENSRMEEENASLRQEMATQMAKNRTQTSIVASDTERHHLLKEELIREMEAEKGELIAINHQLVQENTRLQLIARLSNQT